MQQFNIVDLISINEIFSHALCVILSHWKAISGKTPLLLLIFHLEKQMLLFGFCFI